MIHVRFLRFTISKFFMYRVFSRDVTAAVLVSLNKGTAAMFVSPTNPLGQKFGFIKRVDKGEITTVKDLES